MNIEPLDTRPFHITYEPRAKRPEQAIRFRGWAEAIIQPALRVPTHGGLTNALLVLAKEYVTRAYHEDEAVQQSLNTIFLEWMAQLIAALDKLPPPEPVPESQDPPSEENKPIRSSFLGFEDIRD